MPTIKDPQKIADREAEKDLLKQNKTTRTKKQPNIEPMAEIKTDTTQTTTTTTEPAKTETTTTNQTPAGSINEPAKTQSTGNGFKVFKGNMINRGYSTPKIDMSLANVDIPEASYGHVKPETAQNAAQNLEKTISQANTTNTPPLHQQINEQTGFNQLPTAEQNAAASLSVELLFEGYDGLHAAARWFIKPSKDKLQQMTAENKINLDKIIVPETATQDALTVGLLVDQVCVQVDREIVVKPEFKDKIRAPLERLCAKYGLGASDAMFVGAMVAKDVATKGAMAYGLKKTLNQVLDIYSKQHINEFEIGQAAIRAHEDQLNKQNEAIANEQARKDKIAQEALAKQTDALVKKAEAERLKAEKEAEAANKKNNKNKKSSLANTEEKEIA